MFQKMSDLGFFRYANVSIHFRPSSDCRPALNILGFQQTQLVFFGRFLPEYTFFSPKSRPPSAGKIKIICIHKGSALYSVRMTWEGRFVCMPKVVVKENEQLDDALRRFKRQVSRNGTLAEARKREFYVKPGVRRKLKSEAARKARRGK